MNRRQDAKLATMGVVRALRAELFDKQLAFLDDKSLYKAALCTRRAGKTSMWARYCTIEALRNERVLIRIWAISRMRVKQLLWEEFKYLAGRHLIKIQTNETELTIRFSNGSEIRLLGADKDKEVQKKRGDKTWMEVVLESQLFGPLLKPLVEDVADPCLMDERVRGGGVFCLEGTPGPVCAGYWYDVTGRDDTSTRWQSKGGKDGLGAGWSCHRWSVLDNPHMPHAKGELTDMKRRRRWADDNPTYLREWRALWVNDLGALFYKFNENRNLYDTTKVQPWGPGWEHVLGWDLGFRDDMALVVWGWHASYPDLYEAFSWKKPGALAHEVMDEIEELEKKGFNIVKKVADTGGGGRMYVEEVMSRYSQVFEAAKKTDKYEHVRLFNDALLTGHLKVRPGSPLAEELSTLPTDPDWPDPEKPEKPPSEDPRFPNHCADASLYSFRAAWHYLYKEDKTKPVKGTSDYYQELEAAIERKLEEPEVRAWWEPDDATIEQLSDFNSLD
jgi:hypothetical protein